MDIGHLTDLLPYAFSLAAHFGHDAIHYGVETGQDIWTAIHVHDAMPEAARNFQLIKIAGSTIGLGISAMNISFEGVTAFAIADGEAFMELGKAGHQWRIMHDAAPPALPPGGPHMPT